MCPQSCIFSCFPIRASYSYPTIMHTALLHTANKLIYFLCISHNTIFMNFKYVQPNQHFVAQYCHAFSDRRRVLDWQLDLLQSYTQAQYKWVSPDSLSLTTHDSLTNSLTLQPLYTALLAFFANTILVAAELQVPFLFPWIPTHPLNSTRQLN
jgi:hypothetical protein